VEYQPPPGFRTPRSDFVDRPVPSRGFRSNPSTPSKLSYRSPYVGSTSRQAAYTDDIPQEYVRPLTSYEPTYVQEIRSAAPYGHAMDSVSSRTLGYSEGYDAYAGSPVRQYVRPLRQSLGSTTVGRGTFPPSASVPSTSRAYVPQGSSQYAQGSLTREYAPSSYTASGLPSGFSDQGVITSEGISELGTRTFTREYTRRIGDGAMPGGSSMAGATGASSRNIAQSPFYNSTEPVITSEGIMENGMRTFTREYVRPLGPSGFGGAAGGAAAGGGGAFGGSVGRPGGSVGRLGGSVGRAAAVTQAPPEWSQMTAAQTTGFGPPDFAPAPPTGFEGPGAFGAWPAGAPPSAPTQPQSGQPANSSVNPSAPAAAWPAEWSQAASAGWPPAPPVLPATWPPAPPAAPQAAWPPMAPAEWPPAPPAAWPPAPPPDGLPAGGWAPPPFGAPGMAGALPPFAGQQPLPGAQPTNFDGTAFPGMNPAPFGALPTYPSAPAPAGYPPGFDATLGAAPQQFGQDFGGGFPPAPGGFPPFPPFPPAAAAAPAPAAPAAPAPAEFVPTQDLWAAAPPVMPPYSGGSAPPAFSGPAPPFPTPGGIPAGGPLDDLDN